jgi:hypothetical protein
MGLKIVEYCCLTFARDAYNDDQWTHDVGVVNYNGCGVTVLEMVDDSLLQVGSFDSIHRQLDEEG